MTSKSQLPLPFPAALVVLATRAKLRPDASPIPWEVVAEETHHSKPKVLAVWQWFKDLDWEQAKVLVGSSEEILQLRPDYAARKIEEAQQARWSKLQSEVTDKQQGLNDEFLALVERQQGQLEYLSIISLLRNFYVQSWDLVAEFAEPEIRQAFLNGWRKSWETMDRREKVKLLGVSTVENDVVYERLSQANPDAETWQAMEVYDESKLAFVETFSSWIALVEHTIEQGPQKEDAKGNTSSYTATAGTLTNKLKRSWPDYWLYLRLRGLALACQLV